MEWSKSNLYFLKKLAKYLASLKFPIKYFKEEDGNFLQLDLSKLKNCLVYCDPPYESTTNYRDGFDHDVFWNFVRDISCYNLVYISEYNAPDDFESIWEGVVTTSLSKSIRKKDIEKLFIIGE